MARAAGKLKRILLNCAATALVAPASFAFADGPIAAEAPTVATPRHDAAAGELETIRERYPEGSVRIEREVTQDAERNYVNHGSWKMFDKKSTLLAEGTYQANVRHGVWNRWYHRGDAKAFGQAPYNEFTAPFVSQATFEDGKIHGRWVILDAKQRKVCEIFFAEGLRHGPAVWYYPSGQELRRVEYHQGIHDGEWIDFDRKGQVSARHIYQQGRRLATKVERHSGGVKKSEGVYLFAPLAQKTGDDWWNAVFATYAVSGDDIKHGPWTEWHKNGKPALTGNFERGLADGEFTWWYANGQKSIAGSYDQGKQIGEWVWWHENGQKLTIGRYEDGHPTGDWIAWRKDGRIVEASAFAEDAIPTPVPEEQPARGARRRDPLEDGIKPIR